MTRCNRPITTSELKADLPQLEPEVCLIMQNLKRFSAEDLSKAVGISHKMACGLHEMIYDFPLKSSGCKAIEAFTGVVFKALSYKTLSKEEQHAFNNQVRIISSLYGILRPQDIVKQYRFDYTTQLAPENTRFCNYWKDKVTSALINTLREQQQTQILNLLPADASRTIDWRSIATHAEIYTAHFREIIPGGTTKTPTAGNLKTLRGRLLRQIITQKILKAEDLIGITSESYYCDNIENNSDIVFTTIKNI